jgi:hypothetical protein
VTSLAYSLPEIFENPAPCVCEEIIKFSPLFLKSPISDKDIMALAIWRCCNFVVEPKVGIEVCPTHPPAVLGRKDSAISAICR